MHLPPPHDQCLHRSRADSVARAAGRARPAAASPPRPARRPAAARGTQSPPRARAGRACPAARRPRRPRSRPPTCARVGHPLAPQCCRWRMQMHATADACARPLQEPCGQRPMARSACVRRCAVLPCTAAAAPCDTPAACKAPTLLGESQASISSLLNERERWQQLCSSAADLHNRMCPHCWETRCRVPARRPRRSAASAATPPPRSRTAASSAAGVASAAHGLLPPGGGCSACQPAGCK